VLTAVLCLAVVGALGTPPAAAATICATAGPLPGLTNAQAANARTIVAASTARGGHPAALVALVTAITESGLRVLANPNDPSGAAYPNQGTGSDHDSLGLFQQRPGWGSAAQRMDPAASTTLFLDALLRVPDWGSVPPSYAAQLVQRSAYDGQPRPANHYSPVVGGNYQAQVDEALAILTQVEHDSAHLDCGASASALTPGSAAAHGLPAGYTIPSAATPAARTAVTFALAQLGKPYQWGATGPDTYDCSGLTQQAWRRAGIAISRTTYDQIHDGTPTDAAHLAPGDLVLTPGGDGTIALPGHVGMFIGHGLVVAAPKTGDVVTVVTYASFVARGLSGLRHIA